VKPVNSWLKFHTLTIFWLLVALGIEQRNQALLFGSQKEGNELKKNASYRKKGQKGNKYKK
jgi:hypothetical protein